MSELASAPASGGGSPPPDEQEHDLENFLRPLVIDDNTVHSLAYLISRATRHDGECTDNDASFCTTDNWLSGLTGFS